MLAAVGTQPGARRPWLAPAFVAVGALGAALYVRAVDPTEAGHYPTCPVRAVTGLACPGCGATRAMHALAHLDLGAALGFNVLAVAALPLLVVLWARWAARRTGHGAPPLAAPRAVWALAALVVAFTVVRNLSFGASLGP